MADTERSGTPGAAKRFEGKARLTPYEIAFGEAGFENRIFPRIRAEAEQQGVDSTHPDRFPFLSVAAEAIREVVPPDAPPESMEEYRLFLYHAFNFWLFGKRLYVLDPGVARFLVEAAPDLSGWEVALPQTSAYVQLPANLFWASVSPDMPPEPVDGFFVCCTDGLDARGAEFQTLEVLMVLGVRRDRAGFSLIHFDTEIGPGIAASWTEAPARDEGRDFESVLPGGEMAGLYSIVTVPEALKLIARSLWYVDQHPVHVSAHGAAERRSSDRAGSIPFSHLAFHRVSLHEGDGEAGADAP